MNSLQATTLEAELGSLFERHSGRIFGYCLRRLPSREEAEDAVQHTFLNAYRGLRQGVVPRSETAWLFKIAENVCRERRRSAWRRSRVESAADPDGLAAIAAAPERSHDELAGLADALAELPPNQQRAILLREWQGLSYREIATELGASEAAVETLLFRARRSLARKLDHSRGKTWGLNLGPALGWAKSLFGGAAAKVAATAIVVAGVAAATPAVRHDLTRAFTGAKHHRTAPMIPVSSRSRATSNTTSKGPASGRVSNRLSPTTSGGQRHAHPVEPPTPAGSPGSPPAGTGVPPTVPPASTPPPPSPPKVQLPPAPPVPPLPQPPPVSIPPLPKPPPVSVPPVPPLPPLPPPPPVLT
ncbi:MAG: RNA polymerase sigma factor [Gaiellaceae bacterium]